MGVTNEEIELAQRGSSQEMYRMIDRLKREVVAHMKLTRKALDRMQLEADELVRLKAAIRKHKRDKWGDYHVKDEGDETLYKQTED